MKYAFINNRPFALLGLFGIPLLVFAVIIENLFPVAVPEGYKSFIVAFEFSKTPQQLNELFQGFSLTTLNRINTGNTIDFGFIVTYSLFLMLFFLKASKIFHRKWPLFGILFTAIVFLADIFENIFLFRVTNLYLIKVPEEQLASVLKTLHIVTWIKWGGMAVIFTFFSIKTLGRRVLSTFEGIIFILPLLLSLWALTGDASGISNFTLSVIVAFSLLLVYCVRFHLP